MYALWRKAKGCRASDESPAADLPGQRRVHIGRLQSGLSEEKGFSEVPKVQRRIIRSLHWYKHQHSNPKVAMVKAYESGAYTLAQIAGHFGVHYSTVSLAVKQPE
jgi:REP-associated tyrosine transposase